MWPLHESGVFCGSVVLFCYLCDKWLRENNLGERLTWVHGFKSFSPWSVDSVTSSRISREYVEKARKQE